MPLDTNPMQLDDNLVNGQTYTFVFQLQNLFFTPSESTLLNDVIAQAPDFLTSVQVAHQERFFSGDYFNVQFTYEGDGSDVVTDLASVLVAAFAAGSNDKLTFVQAIGAPATAVPTQIQQVGQAASQVASQVEQSASNAVNKVATDATKAATDAINAALKGLMPLLIVGVLIILFVLPSLVGSYSKVAPRVSVGN